MVMVAVASDTKLVVNKQFDKMVDKIRRNSPRRS